MPDRPVEVAGLRCDEVLALLSELVDGQLDAERAAAVTLHVQGCDWCERFGGSFGAVIAGLRARLGPAEPLDAAALSAVRGALDRL